LNEKINPLKQEPLINEELREILKSQPPEFRRFVYLTEALNKHLQNKRDAEGVMLFLEFYEALFALLHYLRGSAGKRRGT